MTSSLSTRSAAPKRRARIQLDAAGSPLTERQSAVRIQLVEAAMDLFHRKGFDATTVSEITDAVGKVKRTFFRYFKSKDDVAFDWMEEQGEFLCSTLAARPPNESPMQSMREAFLALSRRHDADEQDRVHFLTHLILDTPTLSDRYHHEYVKWEAEFARLIKRQHTVSKGEAFSLSVQIAVVNSAFNLALRTWVASGGKAALADWVAVSFASFGIGELMPAPKSTRSAR